MPSEREELLSIVIPVYNEAENIPPTLAAIHQQIAVPHEVLIVYDVDTDTSIPVVQALQAQYPTVRLVKNTVARGPSGAIRTGFLEAKGQRILVTMADLCDDLGQVGHLIDLMRQGAHVVCPSRYCAGGRQELKDSLKLRAPRLAGRLLHRLAGVNTVDPTNSFKLYSAELLRSIRLRSTISFSVTLEIVAKAHALDYRVVEVPTVWRDRQHGKTNFKLGRSLVAYFPWFCLAMLRGRFLRLPGRLLSRWLRKQD